MQEDPQAFRDAPEPFPAAALGGHADFRSFYEALAPSLCAWARLRTVGSALDPEDLLQEVWVRALERSFTYDLARGSLRGWVFGLAKHVHLEVLRRRRALEHGDGPPDSAALRAWPDVATSIRTRMARSEAVERLIEHVASIDDLDRKILIHCGLEEMPAALVAIRLGLGEATVVKRWQRLRARLRTGGVESLLAD